MPPKPKPGGIHKALEALGTESKLDAWYVGDAKNGCGCRRGGWCAFRLGRLRIRIGSARRDRAGYCMALSRCWICEICLQKFIAATTVFAHPLFLNE